MEPYILLNPSLSQDVIMKDSLKLIGPGVERLAEEIKDYFSQNTILALCLVIIANTPIKIKKIIDEFQL